MKRVQYVRASVIVLALIVITLPTRSHALDQQPTAQTQAGPNNVFLPMIAKAGETPPPPPPPPFKGALYLTKAVKTASASTQVDATGGTHVAFAHYVSMPDPSPAVYGVCAAPVTRCADPANWQYVQLADGVRDVQLQLTPAGQPRLLIVTSSTVYRNGKDYLYAACDSTCTNRNQWSVVRVVSSDGTAIFDVNDDSAP